MLQITCLWQKHLPLSCSLVMSMENKNRIGESEIKIVQTASMLLGKQLEG